MTITRSDIQSWTNVGAKDAAASTYLAVQTALDRWTALKQYDYEVFLQGSYANATNTRGDSDVDIVVMLKSAYMPNIERLSVPERVHYEASRTPASVTVATFRSVVNDALVDYFGSPRVKPKDKCIRVDKRDGYVDADVVPCYEYRLFTSYPSYGSPQFIQGIDIRPLSGGSIVNYPKRHKANGETKNGICNWLYKPTVRQVKRLRRRAVDEGTITKDQAPGYLLECLTYNCPDSLFVADDVQRLVDVVQWLYQFTGAGLRENMWSADEIHQLFVDDPGQHNEYTAERTIATLRGML